MVERRWPRRAAPLVLAAGLAALAGAGGVTADEQPWDPPPCAPSGAGRSIDAAGIGAGGPWFRLDGRLDDQLALAGQTLAVGLADGSNVRSLTLAAESFAAGPFGAVIVAGSDDGTVSAVRAVDVAAGCATTLATERSVIRRATIDPTGSALYEFRVDRRSRADLGVWRRPLDRSSAPVRVLGPLPADERFGPTFTTELTWSVDGTRLVVTSCGDLACRARLLDVASGAVAVVQEPGIGEVIGATGDALVAYEPCHGLPCDLVAISVATGELTTLAEASGLAVLVGTSRGPRIVHETATAPNLRVIGVDGRERAQLPAGDELRLVPSAPRAGAGVTVPAGSVALAEDGHAVGPDGDGTELRDITSGRRVSIQEVIR